MSEIVVAGYVKSGTNLTHRLVCNYLNYPEKWNHFGDCAAIKAHWIDQIKHEDNPDRKLILVVRNPYHASVSAYHYYMKTFGFEYGYLSLEDFIIERFCKAWKMWPYSWSDCVRGWMILNPDTTFRFEDLLSDNYLITSVIVKGIGLDLNNTKLSHSILHSFKHGSYTPRDHVLNERQRGIIHYYCGEIVNEFDYE